MMKAPARLLALFGITLLVATVAAVERGGRPWTKAELLKKAMAFIEETKEEFATRAMAVQNQTGEKVALDFQYYHERTPEQEANHQRFLKGRGSSGLQITHLEGFLGDLERVRKQLFEAEARASKAWLEQHGNTPEMPAKEISFELFGQEIHTRKLGAIVDNSPSMEKHLEKVRAEVESVFPDYRYLEVRGSYLRLYQPNLPGRTFEESWKETLSSRRRYAVHGFEIWKYARPHPDQNPFDPRFFNPSMPAADHLNHVLFAVEKDNLAAMRALIELEGVDSIYWFCDLDDEVELRAVVALGELLSKNSASLFLHSLDKNPAREFRAMIEETGGAVIRKRLR